MTEEQLNGAEVNANFQQVNGERVASHCGVTGCASPTAIPGKATRPLGGPLLRRLSGMPLWDEPPGRPAQPATGAPACYALKMGDLLVVVVIRRAATLNFTQAQRARRSRNRTKYYVRAREGSQ